MYHAALAGMCADVLQVLARAGRPAVQRANKLETLLPTSEVTALFLSQLKRFLRLAGLEDKGSRPASIWVSYGKNRGRPSLCFRPARDTQCDILNYQIESPS